MADPADTPSCGPKSDSATDDLILRRWRQWRSEGKSDAHQLLVGAGQPDVARVLTLLCVDQRQRWSRGEAPPAEEYLKWCPALADDKERALELVYGEFLLREQLGHRPDSDEYLRRFPEHAARLEQQFELHRALARGASDNSPPAVVGNADAPVPVIAGYRVLGELGRGGMGVVYKAVQESLGRHVALKVLATGAGAGRFLERFRREARAAARLHHSNIIPIFDVGEADGHYYYAMQFIQGQGLDAVLEEVRMLRGSGGAALRSTVDSSSVAHSFLAGAFHQGPSQPEPGLSPRPTPAKRSASFANPPLSGPASTPYFHSVARLGLQAAEALAYSHGQGVLHRDVKPSNLLLDIEGTLWVADFGLAKAEDGDDLTDTGDILGTIRYMAPERFTGRADARSDVYGLGATLYELLTLRPAFDQIDKMQLIAKVTTETPPLPRRLDPRIPRDLETVVLRAMASDPAARYQSAGDLADDLRRFLSDRPIKARRFSAVEHVLRWGRRNRTVAALTVAVALLLVMGTVGSGVAALWLRRQRDDAVQARQDADTAGRAMKEKLWESLRDQARAGIFSRRRGQRFESLKAIREAVRLGRELGLPAERFGVLRELATAALALPDVRMLRQWQGWTPDCRQLVCDGNLQRYARCDAAGNISVRRTDDDVEIARVTGYAGDQLLQLSPDGRYLVTHKGRSLLVWQVDTSSPVLLMKESQAVRADFTPDNRLMFYRPDGSVLIRDLSAADAAREITRLPGARGRIAVHPRGDRFAVYADGGLLVCDLVTGAVLSRLTGVQSFEARLAWHPSGEFLAIPGADRRVRIWDVIADREVSELSGFTNDSISPVFTAGGDLLVTSGWEGLIRFWDWRSGRQVLCVPGSFAAATCYCDNLLVTQLQGRHNTAVWHVDAAREHRTVTTAPLPGRDLELWSAAFHPLGRILSVATSRGAVLWDLDSRRELCRLPETPVHVLSEPRGALLANCNDGLFRRPMEFKPGPEPCLTLGPAERLVHPGTGRVIDISRDGRVFGLALSTGALVQDGKGRVRHLSHEDCRSVSLSPDGRLVATGSHNGSAARIWRMDAGTLVKELLPDVGIMGVRFSPAGNWLATTGGGLRLWHVGTWEAGPVIGNCGVVAFSDDESLLALETGSGRIRLLEAANGREFAQLVDPSEDRAGWVGFAPDGTRLVTTTQVGKVFHIWDLRLIRAGLAELGLDWDVPPFPPAPPSTPALPIKVDVRPPEQRLPARELPPKESVAAYSLAIALLPYNPEALYRRGVARMALKDWKGARNDFDIAIQLNPGQSRYLRERARACLVLKDYDRVLEDYGGLLVLEPRNPELSNNLAWILVTGPQRLRDPARALALAREAVRLAPKQSSFLNTLGVVLYRNGRFAESRRAALEKSLTGQKIPPAFDLYFLAMCHHGLGAAAEARDCYDRALESQGKATLPPSSAEELCALRAEAAKVLGLPTPPGP